MLIVSDTSPIRGLSAIDQLGLIPALYGEALLPPAVMAELAVPVGDLPLITPTDVRRVVELSARLNPGEAEAIALALELNADALLIDERRGRQIAQQLGVRSIGVLGILVAAKEQSLVPAVAPLIERLRERIGFRVAPALLMRILQEVGEGPR